MRYRLDPSQLLAILIVTVGIVVVALYSPPEALEKLARIAGHLPWQAIAGACLAGGGMAASTMAGKLVQKRTPSEPDEYTDEEKP